MKKPPSNLASKNSAIVILFCIFGIGLILRLLLTPYLSYRQDVYTYIYWSESLLKNGPKLFFVDNWVDYLPGYPYLLWVLAWIKSYLGISAEPQLMLLYKIPAIIADIFTAIIIYKLLRFAKQTIAKASLATAAYLFSPAVFSNSALWGQTDSFTGLAAVGALYFTLVSQPFLAGLMLGIGTLIKLNTILIAPILAIIMFQKLEFKRIIITFVIAAGIFTLGFVPFQNQPHILQFISNRISITTNQYQHTSLNAFNLWYLLDGSWKSDQDQIFGLTKHLWGSILFLGISAVVLIRFFIKSSKSSILHSQLLIHHSASSAATIFTTAFLLLTRMHERHFFAALPFLVIAAAFSARWWVAYAWYSLSYITNLIFGFQQSPSNPTIIPLPSNASNLISAINLGVLGYILAFKTRIINLVKLPPLSSHQPKAIIIILLFALVFRLLRLGTPPVYHFDEVYHAFTAQEMLKGNVKAWEWWNESPKGVAYEWTHPPLSKHFMVLGMQILGDGPWGWRIPSVLFGIANIYLVYLISKQLFPQQLNAKHYSLNSLPLIAAGLYSVESLTFVQSRIGMNDTYMLFFVLFSLYALLKGKLPASMLGFGLAIATKWSAVYITPLLGLIIIAQNRRHLVRIPFLAICYLLSAICLYLLSYAPFFASGHTWKQFTELQQQMFWYHTRLNATHDYSSPAWSWPILLRPVWYYVHYGDDTVANIYALGNPIIFWGGVVAVVSALVVVIKNLIKKSLTTNHYALITLLIGYLVFFLPWLFSPRIMFLYHYLPAIPFMVIILAWTLSHHKTLAVGYVSLAIYAFIFFYPQLTALPVPTRLTTLFYWLPTWK